MKKVVSLAWSLWESPCFSTGFHIPVKTHEKHSRTTSSARLFSLTGRLPHFTTHPCALVWQKKRTIKLNISTQQDPFSPDVETHVHFPAWQPPWTTLLQGTDSAHHQENATQHQAAAVPLHTRAEELSLGISPGSPQTNGLNGVCAQWCFTQPLRRTKLCPLQENGWSWSKLRQTLQSRDYIFISCAKYMLFQKNLKVEQAPFKKKEGTRRCGREDERR